ncbi:heparan sulfate 2-O-sulfotransferase pipe-like, partial [Agrilus planipennis]|uniref:Heparan sulfate 2-O-sulfotransferase pipe-like n=1 Tax=Agrilus planipennis TaxID=224129 RepID=A0A1W4XBA8_AGRPL
MEKLERVLRQRRMLLPKRTSELVALMAISTTLFLFIHTRELSTKLREMEVRLQPEDLISSNQILS